MALLNFPPNPTDGELYTIGTNTWIWNATLQAWLKYNNPITTLSYLTVTNSLSVTTSTQSTSTTTGAVTVTGGVGIGGNLNIGGTLLVSNIYETVNIIAGAINSTPTAYFTPGAVTYYTSTATANWIQNLTYSSSVTLNSVLAVGQSASTAVLAKQGSPAYYMTGTLTIDGSSSNVSVYWQGGSAPSGGYVTGIDSYTYTVIKTAATPAYTVLASLAQF